MCSSPFANARSLPGVFCRCSQAPRAVAVARGSTTTCRAPGARPASNHCITGGIVSAGLLPTSSTACASAISLTGNGNPRSIPNARLLAAAAEDMQNRPL